MGANCGFYSLLAASLVKPSGKVYCFEPNPTLIPILKKSIELNHFSDIIICENMAITNIENENIPFYLPSDKVSSASGSLISDKFEKEGMTSDLSILIKATTLDSYFSKATLSGKILLKIDAEGAEFLVLEGMKKLLEKKIIHCIIMECESEISPACNFLIDFGYKIIKIERFNHYDNFGNYFFEIN